MVHLGDFPASHTAVCFLFDSFAYATGAPSSTSSFANTDVIIYKDLGTTERSSASGIAVTADFDSRTGINKVLIDLSDNTDAGFYATGHEYQVVIDTVTIDSVTMRFVLGSFSIERAGGVLALLKGNAVKVDLNTIKTQSVTAASAVTILASVGTAATSTAQTGDTYARLGAPAGASIAADVAAVKTDTAAVKVQTDKLVFTVTNQVDANVLDWKSATAPAMTGDAYARLGAPAGASVSADIAAAKVDTAAIKVQTDKLAFTVANQVDSNVLDWKSATAPAMTGDAYARLGAPAGSSVSADVAAVKVDTAAVKAKTDNLPEGIKKNTALTNFEFFMVDSADHVTGKTGLTVAGAVSIDGAGFGALTNTPATEVANGIYKIDLAAGDVNGTMITLKFTSSGADARFITLKTCP